MLTLEPFLVQCNAKVDGQAAGACCCNQEVHGPSVAHQVCAVVWVDSAEVLLVHQVKAKPGDCITSS